MKKQSILAVTSLAFILCGCSGYSTEVSKGNKTIMTIGDTTYTKKDEYELLKTSNGTDQTINDVRQIILDKEIGRKENIVSAAQKQYEELAKDTEDIETQIQAAGYSDKDDYINNALIPSIQSEKLMSKYFKAAKSQIKKDYKPSVAKILQCDNEENAKKALAELKKGTDEKTVFEQYQSESSSFGDDETLITTSTNGAPTRLINTLYKTKSTGVIDEVFTNSDDETDTSAYVAILVNNDYDSILDRIEDTLSSDSEMTTKCLVYYMKKYNFEVHDQQVFDSLKSSNPEYLISHPELSSTNE